MKAYHYCWILLMLLSCESAPDRILFSSNRAGNSDIYLIDQKGGILEQISTSEYEEWGPVWINENEISFLRQEDSGIQLIRLNLKTLEESQIDHPVNCTIDDKNIVYSKEQLIGLYTCNGDVFLIHPEKEAPENLTKNMEGVSNYVDWIDEQNVLFTNNQGGNNEIYSLNLDSGEMTNLTTNQANDERGAISPDGNFLLFSSDRFEKGNQDILVQDLSNGSVQNISNSPGTELIARWSRDGQKVYFGSNKDGNWEIYAYDLQNNQTIRLTNDPGFDGDPRIN